MNQKFKFHEKSLSLPLIVRKPIAVMNYKLYEKYQHSQNYYYLRDINEILNDASTKIVIHFKDQITIDEDEEYLKRFYKIKEFFQKIGLLTEYYKFHVDIARIFQEPICSILNKYYDKKRKYDYFRIAKMIEEENKLNPNKPPKGIVGERPSPANSQESVLQERDDKEDQNIKNIQILKELSWLKHEKTLPKEVSQTINEFCKQLGSGGDQSTLSLVKYTKQDKVSLDNFLLYIGNKANLNQRTSPTARQSQEQLIQELIMNQKAKISQKDNKSYSMHKKNETKYSIGSIEIRNNFVKDQFNNISKKSNRQASTDIIESGTRLENKPQDLIKVKSKTIVSKNQLKINKFIGDLNQNSPTLSLHKISIGSTSLKSQQPLIQSQNNHKPPNQLTKLLLEEAEQQQKLRNGAITHRPMSGTNAFFGSSSTRNSPTINYQKLNIPKQFKDDYQKYQKLKTTNSPQKNHQLGMIAKDLFIKALNSQKYKNSIHIKQSSNQEKVLNQYNKQKYNNVQQQQQQNNLLEKKQHKKNKSDGRALQNKLSIHEIGCLTDRNIKETNQLLSKLNKNSSPQTRRLHSEKQESLSGNMKGILIQQMLKSFAKQNLQNQQDLKCLIKNQKKKF
ncbi:unnamed protein product [Paramecium primaurelia]|uniref:Uncharacterized protein n=1 Tax=Paramecium primaurelia TaxID=5886 RepID=A0A8S1Q6S5_PARPR|nr:unnamed protein product [Paramecium primaurelia]